MRILLVISPTEEYTTYRLPHLGMGYLVAVLDDRGYEVDLLDMNAEKKSCEDLKRIIERKNFDVLGLTATTPEIMDAHKVAETAKNVNEDITTIIGGAHATALPTETLEKLKHFDVAVVGEGEHTLIKLLDSLGKDDLSSVNGIAYRKNGIIKINPPGDILKNIDEISFPSWSAFKLKHYKGVWGLRKKLEFPLLSGRGCPYQCVFCQRVLGSKVRLRSVSNVVDEIEYDLELGAKSIFFVDETFTISKKRTIDLCNEILQRGLNDELSWWFQTRVDLVDREILSKVKEAGCRLVNFGVESANSEILKKIKKDVTIAQTKKAFKVAREVGLKTEMNLIFGLPYDTTDTITESINLMMQINPDYVTIGILVPFPGTEVSLMAKKGEGGLKLISTDWGTYGKQLGSALELDSINRSELNMYQSKAYSKFYFRPSRIRNLFELVSFTGIYKSFKRDWLC